MRHLLVALAASAGVLAAGPATAVTFDFSFTNVLYGGGLVEGTVSNLANNATGPGDVQISSNAGGFGVGSYNGNETNSFTVANGAMISLIYVAFGESNTDPATGCCSLALSSGNGAGLSDVPNGVARSADAPVIFTLSPTQPAPVPLPATLALLAAGLALLATVARRRPRAPA